MSNKRFLNNLVIKKNNYKKSLIYDQSIDERGRIEKQIFLIDCVIELIAFYLCIKTEKTKEEYKKIIKERFPLLLKDLDEVYSLIDENFV